MQNVFLLQMVKEQKKNLFTKVDCKPQSAFFPLITMPNETDSYRAGSSCMQPASEPVENPMKKSIVHPFVSTLVKLVVTVGIIWYIVNKLGWNEIAAILHHARAEWIGTTALVFLISNCLGAFQWQLLLKNKGVDLSFFKCTKLYFIGMFFSNFIAGMAAADAVRVTYLKIENKSAKSGFAATFLDRFAGLVAMLAFAAIGSFFLLKQKALENKSLDIAIVALFAVFALLLCILVLIISSRFQKLFFSLLSKSPFPSIFKEGICAVASEVILEAHDRHIILPVVVLSTIIQLLRIFGNITCAASLNLLTPANAHYFFIFVPMLAMLMIIPLPFGVREGLGGTLFMFAGFQPKAAIVMGFLTSVVGIIVTLPGAIAFLIHPIKKNASGPQSSAASSKLSSTIVS
jgi:glycosyltransferase 2 family protein